MLRPAVLVAVLAALIATAFAYAPASGAEDPCADTLCAGAASVDMTWHTGSGQGQYGTEGNGLTSDKFDPFHHQTKMVPSDGMQSRLFAKAIVVKGDDGSKVAYVKTELYLQQDLLTRRVAELVSGADPVMGNYAVEGLDGTRIMLGATHNHSAPEYVSTAWGVWLFTDSFDFRAFEITARKIAQAIKEADQALTPARIGASVTPFSDVQHNILGPATADDGSPAGFPRDHFDDELSVIRFDALNGPPIAAWVNLGMHPESMNSFDLISGDFVGMVERIVEREMGREPGAPDGPVVAWSQGSVGDVEPDQDARAHPTSEKRQYWHKDISQAERMSRDLSAAVLDTWEDVAAETPGVPEKFVPFSSDLEVDMVDYRFPGPPSHPLPTVSNCRTERPGLPIIGLPDCEREGFVPPEQYGTTIGLLQGAGIPIPDNFGTSPSYGAVQESTTIHLQALRLGDILVGSCPCEPISDMVLNFKSRTDEQGGAYNGYHWECRETPGGPTANECNFRRASHHEEADDWRPVSDAAYELMLAQIDNNAAGWEESLATLQGESEPEDPAQIKGNFTHREIQDLGQHPGYRLPIMVGQSNDYVGYIVTYREYMRGDHYRKALTAFGPHTADYVNTRLVRMAAELDGGPSPDDAVSTVASSADGLIQLAKTLVVGKGATAGLGAYGAAIPDDGGTPGAVEQPGSLQRFGAATFTWVGGSNWTDNPVVVVEREVSPGHWETFATQDGGEVILTLAYESPFSSAALDWLSGGKTYEWTAHLEAFEETPPGTYRFVVDGHHRSERSPNPYLLESESFDVSVWEEIAAHDLTVDTAAAIASFRISGVEATEDPSMLETDDDGFLSSDEVHYPETYDSPLDYIERSYSTSGAHRYCLRCTFRPWANTGRITAAEVTVLQSDGVIRTYPTSLDEGAWAADGLDLANGDFVVVSRGGVVDEYGNINGAQSNRIGPLTGLTDRQISTTLEYTGDTQGRVGTDAQVAAVLRSVAGEPLEGKTITFTRGKQSAAATTGADGIAQTALKITGPRGDRHRLVVSFAGEGNLLPTQIDVEFTATSPAGARSQNAFAVAGLSLLVLLLLYLVYRASKRLRPQEVTP